MEQTALQRLIAAYKMGLAESANRLGAWDETWGRNETISLNEERRRLAGEGKYRLAPFPYPGLRSFDPQEGENFFGRERNVADVQNRLVAARMVVVLGGSGSGKSSLLRAGLLPYLNTTRRIPGRDGGWYTAEFRPRTDPLCELSDALVDQWLLPLLDLKLPALAERMEVSQGASAEQARPYLVNKMHACFFDGTKVKPRDAILAALLDIAGRQLDEYDLLASGGLRVPRPNLMVLLDQLEEVFRPEVPPEARTSLLNLIVDLHRHFNGRPERGGLFFAMTMRSEELHRCPEHRGLSEVINQSFYLLDLLDPDDPADRPDLHRAIVQPARNVFEDWGLEYDRSCADAPFAKGMPDWLLEGAKRSWTEIEHRPDQLPLLQHALQAIWHGAMRRWSANNFTGDRLTIEPADLPGQKDGEVEAPDLGACLSARADKAAERAAQRFAAIAQTSLEVGERALQAAFRALARRDDRGTWARRFADPDDMQAFMAADPTLEIAETNGALWEALRQALDVFVLRGYLSGGQGRSYDISHEALIRNWPKFREWLREPEEVASALNRVLEDVDPRKFQEADDFVKMQLIPPYVAGKIALLEGGRELPEKWAEDQIAPALAKPAVQERWGREKEKALQEVVALAGVADDLRRQAELARRQKELQEKQRELEQAHALAKEQKKRLIAASCFALVAVCLAAFAWWQAQIAGKNARVAETNAREASFQEKLKEVNWIDATIGRIQNDSDKWQAQAIHIERDIRGQAKDTDPNEDQVTQNLVERLNDAIEKRDYFLRQVNRLIENRNATINKIKEESARRWKNDMAGSEREQVIAKVVQFLGHLNSVNSGSAPDVNFNAQSTLRMALYAAAAIPEEQESRLNGELLKAINNYWQLDFFTPPGAPQVWGMAVDPKSRNGLRAAVGDDNGVVWLWNALNLPGADQTASRNLAKLTGAAGIVNGLAFSADGNWLAAAYRGAGSAVWDLRTQTLVCNPGRPGDEGGAYGVAFYETTLAVAVNDRAVHLWHVSEKECRKGYVFKASDVAYGVAFGPGKRLAAAGGDGTVTVWEIDAPNAGGRKFLTGDKFPVFAVAFSPDGNTLAATAADGRGYLWDMEKADQAPTVLSSGAGTVGQVAFSPNGQWLVATAKPDGTAIVMDVRDPKKPKELWYLGGEGQGLFSVAFSPDSKYLLTGNNLDGIVGVWVMTADEKIRKSRGDLIELGLSRVADINLKESECRVLRELNIPIFLESGRDSSGICQLPFLRDKPGRLYPLPGKTPLSGNH